MRKASPLLLGGRPLVAGGGPFVFGVLNVTPDSFSDGGTYRSPQEAVAAGERMAADGADVIDVGGESTRPGSRPVPPDEQRRRVEPVIAALARRLGPGGPAISIDTRSAVVASAAIEAGASLINDVSALRDDPAMAEVAARHGCGVVLMHMQGSPETMQVDPCYEDVIGEIAAFLADRVAEARRHGLPAERLILDPGIGFGKTTQHNLQILANLPGLRVAGLPLLVGPSRKRFIGEVLGLDRPADRLAGTLASVAAAVLAGAECVRVHDVRPAREVADLCAAIRRAGASGSSGRAPEPPW